MNKAMDSSNKEKKKKDSLFQNTITVVTSP